MIFCDCAVNNAGEFMEGEWSIEFCEKHEAAPETAAERDRLLVSNAELLGALQNLTGCFSTNMLDQNNNREIWMAGLAIIRKTTEGG